jgi:hypothetical protein
VRRTFTDGNLSAINTDADRFMKADLRGGVAQGGFAAPSGTDFAVGNHVQASSNGLQSGVLPAPGGRTATGLPQPGISLNLLLQATGSRDVLIAGLGNDLVKSGIDLDFLVGGFGHQTPAGWPAAAGSAGASPSQAQAASDGFWADSSFRAGQARDWHNRAEEGSGTSTTDLVMSLADNGDLGLTVQPACAAAWLGDADREA